jgi:protein TonB
MIKAIIAASCLLLLCNAGYGQQNNINNPDAIDKPVAPQKVEKVQQDRVFTQIDQFPEFPGGTEGLKQYVKENIRYPEKAKKAGIEGRVVLQFFIDKDGSVIDEKVIRSLDKDCDKEAVRLVRNMPKWKPGLQEGKPLKVMYTLPVTFRLE